MAGWQRAMHRVVAEGILHVCMQGARRFARLLHGLAAQALQQLALVQALEVLAQRCAELAHLHALRPCTAHRATQRMLLLWHSRCLQARGSPRRPGVNQQNTKKKGTWSSTSLPLAAALFGAASPSLSSSPSLLALPSESEAMKSSKES